MTPSEMNAQAIARRKALLDAHKNYRPPPVDPAVQQQLHSEVMRANAPVRVPAFTESRGMVVDERERITTEGRPPSAQVTTQSVEKGEESPSPRGDAQVQARDAEVQLWPESEVQEASDSDSSLRERTVEAQEQAQDENSRRSKTLGEWIEVEYFAETREALDEQIPADARAVTRKRWWRAVALVRKT